MLLIVFEISILFIFSGRLQLEADRHIQNIKNRDTQVTEKR